MQTEAPTRPGAGSLLILVVAVIAISSSAVLVRWSDASAVTLAFWRTLGGALILAPAARRSPVKPTGSQYRLIGVAGVALGIHFSAWLASLELTSVAASVTLVSTAPIIIAVVEAARGRRPPTRTWLAIGLAILGTVIITGADRGGASAGGGLSDDALLGDGLALVGAATMALYLMIGDRLRSTLSTAAYASRTYGVAAITTLAVAVASDTDLVGFDTTTWLAIGAMIAGPQLAGHTALNYLLGRLGQMTVALTLLVEPLGAALLVLLLFGDVPPPATLVGGPLVIAALALQAIGRSNDRVAALTNAARQP